MVDVNLNTEEHSENL
uniref:Uncharacterized protein n=1 Tax=Moniliophthora roreri TaxID=221103 RepID=A0A0W0FB67_MONRR